ncbi:MAG: DUF1934 domain-containing protein [Lachnospiraceae bacterium]|nr:DUF1934 domain-containing protein [Lachnospiraceae bacterium]
MAKKNVKIRITTKHDPDELIKVEYSGTLESTTELTQWSYFVESNTPEGKMKMTITPKNIKVVQSGEITAVSSYETGKTETTIYNLPYGKCEISTTTLSYNIKTSPKGIAVTFDFKKTINNDDYGYYETKIMIMYE